MPPCCKIQYIYIYMYLGLLLDSIRLDSNGRRKRKHVVVLDLCNMHVPILL